MLARVDDAQHLVVTVQSVKELSIGQPPALAHLHAAVDVCVSWFR